MAFSTSSSSLSSLCHIIRVHSTEYRILQYVYFYFFSNIQIDNFAQNSMAGKWLSSFRNVVVSTCVK